MRPFEAIAKDSTVGTVLSSPHYKQSMGRAKRKVEKKDSDGNALQRMQLLYAAAAGCDEYVRDLLKNGVPPNAKNLRGRSPLHMAARQGFTSTVYQLLESGASPFTRDALGDTPLDLARKANHQEVIQLLIRAIHNSDLRDIFSWSIELSGHSNAFNFSDSSLDLPLIHAVRQGKMKLVKQVIVSGSLEGKDSGGYTPLCVAAEKGLHDIVSLLLAHGASVTAANNDGRTALHLAAMRGFKGIVKKLLNHCASPFIEDAYGVTPLALAIFRKHKQIVKILEHAELKSVHIASNNSCRMTGLRAVRREPFDVAGKLDRSLEYSAKEKHKPITSNPIQSHETLCVIQDHVNEEKQIERIFLTEERAMNRKFYQLQERRNWQGAQDYKLIVTKFWERRRMREKMIRARKRWQIAQNRAGGEDEESYDAMKCTEKNVVIPAHVAARARLTKEKVRFLRRGDRRAKHRAAKRAALAARNFFGSLERMRLAKSSKRHEHSPNPDKVNTRIMEKMTLHRSVYSKRIAKQYAPESISGENRSPDRNVILKCDVRMEDLLRAAKVRNNLKMYKKSVKRDSKKLLKDDRNNKMQTSINAKERNNLKMYMESVKMKKYLCRNTKMKMISVNSRFTILDWAACRGTLQKDCQLLKQNNDLACTDKNELAHIAKNDVACVDKSSTTDVHKAARRRNANGLEILLKAGASVDPKDKNGRTPLHQASLTGRIQCVRVLLQFEANVHAKDENGSSALHLATRKGHADCVRFLLENGAQVDLRDNFGDSALHMAAFIGSEECVSVLLESGARVDSAGRQLRTALHAAAYRGHASCVRVLLESGASVEARDEFENTVLHSAARGGNVEAARLLVAAGASCTAKDKRNLTPVDVARADDVRSLLMRQWWSAKREPWKE